MSTICCPKSIKGLAIRVTKADICCAAAPETEANSRVATNGFVTLSLSPEIEAGEEITVKTADGAICIDDKDPDILKRLTIEVLLCGVPIPLLELLLGASALTDGGGNIVGAALPSLTDQPSAANPLMRQLEVWSRNKDTASCAPGSTVLPYVQWLVPCTQNWQIGGDLEFSITQLEITLTADGEGSPGWTPSVAAEWTAGQIATIQGGSGSPFAWKCVAALPDVDDCAYVPAASGS